MVKLPFIGIARNQKRLHTGKSILFIFFWFCIYVFCFFSVTSEFRRRCRNWCLFLLVLLCLFLLLLLLDICISAPVSKLFYLLLLLFFFCFFFLTSAFRHRCRNCFFCFFFTFCVYYYTPYPYIQQIHRSYYFIVLHELV